MSAGSPRLRPSATLIGSMSPTRSATLVSGVASFSVYRSLRCRQVIGRAAPESGGRRAGLRGGKFLGVPLAAVPPGDRQVVAGIGGPPDRLRGDRAVRVLTEFGAGD